MDDPVTRLKKLVEKANDFDVDEKIPAVRYLRSSKEMERMALVYASENESENGFLLYMKLITLLVEKLPRHPLYKALSVDQKKTVKERCTKAFVAAEKLKKSVKEKYEKEYSVWQHSVEKAKQEKDENLHKKSSPIPSPPVLNDQNEIQDVCNNGPTQLAPSAPPDIPIGTQLWGPNTSRQNQNISDSPRQNISSSTAISENHPEQPRAPPSYEQATFYEPSNVPSKPSLIPDVNRSNKPFVGETHSVPVPTFDRDTKPHDFTRQVSGSLDGNRKVVIPADLVPRFLQAVAFNTNRNVETAGILNGTLAQNTLRVTHLVIPKQSGTSDSCTTECEEELFEVQDKYDTITLGWIHTHPSQTAFLSSVDLHTQCSYQQLMPEAIAIVCAPKYHTTGMYRLTLEHGLKFIASCNKVGFHPHPKDPPLFEESPLVTTDPNARIQMVDLRS